MSMSPFLTPDQSRMRHARAAERRRRRQIIGLVLLVAALATIGVVMLARGTKGHAHGPRVRARTVTSLSAPAPPHLSPTGLPLGEPALELAGLGAPAADPVKLRFKHQPREGLLFNLQTGQVLWQHDPDERVRIASLTKMMTALVTVKAAPPDAHVLVTKAALETAGSKVGVLPLHKRVRLETMLYGLLLPSGNDAAVALAQHVAGSVSAFVQRMNQEAARLGLGCTRFSSPSGFYDQGNFSCAADLAVLAHVDMAQPRIASVARTYSAVLPFPIKGGKLYLYNNNPLLVYHYPGTTGLKTGYTEAAGRCLVATAERDGVRLGVVILNSDAPGVQAKQLLDRGFEDVYHLKRVSEPPLPPGA